MPKKRSGRKNRVVKNKLWIYTEGKKTEQIYIKGYINDRHCDNKRVENVCVEDVKQNTAESLVKRIKSDQRTADHNSGDIYWVAYDRESVEKYKAEIHQRALVTAEDANINVALSNVCIEQYLIWHFNTSRAAYTSCDDLLKRSDLKKNLKTVGIDNYNKGDSNLYVKLKHLVDTAKANAKTANASIVDSSPKGDRTPIHELNPYSNFYELLDAIDEFVQDSK